MGAFDLGLQYEQQQRYPDALEAFQQEVLANPSNTAAWVHLGALFLYARRFAEAVEAFNRLLALDPRNAYAWGGIIAGLNAINQQRARTLLQECDRLLAADPNLPDAHYQRGVALLELSGIPNNVELALQEFSVALRMQPQHTLAMGDMAITLAGKRAAYDEASRIANDLLRFDPGSVKGWQALAWVFYGQQQHQAALQILDRALAIDPNNAYSWGLRGGILLNHAKDKDWLKSWTKNDWDLTKQADAAFDRALALDRTDVAALAGKQQVLLRRGELKGELIRDGALLALGFLWW